MKGQWIKDAWKWDESTKKLTRDEFIQTYYPKWVEPWRPDYRIRLNKHGRPMANGNPKVQETKRKNIIDAEYAQYSTVFDSQVEMMRKHKEPTLL